MKQEETEQTNETEQIKKDVASADDLRGLIGTLRSDLEKKSNEGKATVADYVRLVQLYRELEDSNVEEIRIIWVKNEPSSKT